MKTRKLTKKSIISIIIILVAVSTIIGIYSIISNKKTNRTMLSPELERTQAYEDVKDGDNGIKDTDGNDISTVKFDAFFLKDKNGDGIAESIRGTCNEVGGQATLYMNLSVAEEGHLTNGKITINSENFYFNTSIVKDNEVEKNYVSTNTKEIKLKDITNGTQKLLMGSVRSGDYSNSYNKTSAIGNDTSNYSKENSVTFSGTYVDSSGNEKTFTKTVPFVIDWYGETDASITPKTQTVEIKEMNSLVKEEGLELNFDIKTAESKNQLLLESSEITGTIPEFNGYKPTSVKISGTNVTYTYDAETSTYTATKSSIIDENGKITIDDVAAGEDIRKIERAQSILQNALQSLRAAQTEGANSKGETAQAIYDKSQELINQIQRLDSNLEETTNYIRHVLAVYKAKDEMLKAIMASQNMV